MRIVIGEDETLLCEGLAVLLTRAGFTVAAAVGDADALKTAVLQHIPDVIVTDIRMPPTGLDDGLRAGLQLRKTLPGTGLILLSQHLSRVHAVELLTATGTGSGGLGYLWKQRIANARQFAADVRTVGGGGTVLDPDLAASALDHAERVHDGFASLTARQREVLALIASGRSNASIARALSITEKSVVEHTSRIYECLGLTQTGDEHRRVLAVLRFLSQDSS